MSGYIGPIPVPQGIQNKESFTATAAQTTFNTNGYTDGAFISVYLNGVRLVNGTDYTATNGSDVVLASAANTGDVLDFETFNSFSLVSQTFDNLTTKNPTHEDTDGGRESALSFQGEQSGGEISTLAAIQASHDGTADDQKGDLIFKTNDGSDNNAPTERLRIDSNGAISTATLGTNNTRFGLDAGKSIESGGNQNTLIGDYAGDALTTGDNNVAVGYGALSAEDAHGRNVAIGYESLNALNAGADANNVAVGYQAGTALTTGVKNTILGADALDAATTSEMNVAIGHEALSADTQGDKSVAVGAGALKVQNHSDAAIFNCAVGTFAGTAVTTGHTLTLIGANSGSAITTGQNHSVLGKFSGNDNNLDIRTTTEPHIVLSAGDGRPANFFREDQGSFGTWFQGNYANSTYWPIVGTSNGHNAISQNLSAGQLGVTTDSSAGIYINRNNVDGALIYFYSTGTLEGFISVSGSTVSYNGGHLARFSQLTDNSKDASILKGTVMTNLDKMCVWEHDAVAEGDTIKSASGDERTATKDDVADAYTEDNEQLNCMAVSSVEGDPNVSGVFVNWDAADDGYNDMNIAMTGDMVIRIAKGVTIARGDLLMSAGDGTAKPQDDDIVRSKTIAKVTSTNVSHTYDDESFCVPCVLMAC